MSDYRYTLSMDCADGCCRDEQEYRTFANAREHFESYYPARVWALTIFKHAEDQAYYMGRVVAAWPPDVREYWAIQRDAG